MPSTNLLYALILGCGIALSANGASAEWQLFKKKPRAVADNDRGQVELAQADGAAVRVLQLEEQLRLLNGRVEDLTFQLLQLQEELRRMQEDNELRFQDLESKRGIARKSTRDLARAPKETTPDPVSQEPEAPKRDTIATIIGQSEGAAQSAELGLEPRSLGSLTFDENGNIIDSQIDKPIDLTGQGGSRGIREVLPGERSANTKPGLDADLPADPEQLYEIGYGYVQAGAYDRAADVFRNFTRQFADHPRSPEARFWLGESLFAQGQYEEAARVFLDTHKQYPQGRMAPQTLLKLGVSLAGMNQRELACATFAEVPRKYPQISNSVKETLQTEQKAASCLVN